MNEFVVNAVGVVHSPRSEVKDDFWGGVVSTIELDPGRFGLDATAGLDEFSHLEVVFLLDRVDPEQVQTGARRPRNNPDWPVVGIFAQRAKLRPNRIGVSRCRLLKVEGLRLTVEGLDAIEGTPVLDVKPWIEEFGPAGEVRQPDWSHELMREYYAEPTSKSG
jgi:tRNA-Thr(GGU) m(6)t(6)A37 methyltransferase TsaA